MRQQTPIQRPTRFPASESERASIRALKNWLLAGPADNALDDQIVRLRLAAAIAKLSGGKGAKARKDARRVG